MKNPMKTMNRQRGLGFWSFVWSAAVVVLVAVLLIKIIPVYLDNMKLQRALEDLTDQPNIMQTHRLAMIRSLERKLYIDYAHEIVDIKKAFKVKNIKGKREFSIDYERVVPLAYNASLLFDFKNHVTVPK